MSILISDITTGTIDGTGDFDVLAKAIKEHLLLEYEEGRITGDKYAEAYIALLAQAMNAAVQFRVQSEQLTIQSELTDEQKALIVAQTGQVVAETLNVPKQGVVLDKQAENLDVDVQVKTKDIELRESNIKLTDQKTKTEIAQTAELIDGKVVGGTVGKQKEVYDAQIKGFKDDALQKATKLMTDIWTVQRSTDVGIMPTSETKLYDSNIGSSVSTLFTSLNIPVAAVPNAAFVSAVSSATGSEVIQTGENLAISGNVGDNGSTIISITVRDTASKVVQATNTSLTGKTYTASIPSASLGSLAKGELVVTTRIRTSSGGEVSVSDGATKGY